MSKPLAVLDLIRTEDVFALRHCGRSAAAAIGLEEADQVRLATALSELGRQALSQATTATATFLWEVDGSLEVQFEGLSQSAPDLGTALQAARRLVSDVVVNEVADGAFLNVTLTRRPPHDVRAKRSDVERAIRTSLSSGPLEDLRLQNHDLISTLDDLRARQDELLQVNEELDETNKGVMAMYSQLSNELEETNRGVVALYAELDEKTMQLKQVSDSKSQFLASISHELRSPINSIVGLVRLLQDGVSEPLAADQQVQLSYIDESASRLLHLVDELLDLAKAEAGKLEANFTPVSLAAVFSELRGTVRPLVSPGVELVVDPPSIDLIETDHVLLVQVLRNLLSNAAKFTESGWIKLQAKEQPSQLVITVEDTGIGIAAEHIQRIFEDFYQVRGPQQIRHKGTGLGLSYSRKAAEALGGGVFVESTFGEGSKFCISLPLRPKDAGVQGPPRPIGLALIVDDDPAFRHTMRAHLEGLCLKIAEADSGQAALESIRRSQPDVVFLDLSMPETSGEVVLAMLRSDPRLDAMPVVVVTSTRLDALGPLAGATTLLSKTGLDRVAVASCLGVVFQGSEAGE